MKRKISFKLFLGLHFFILFCVLSPSHCLFAEDKVVAVVNNDVITQKDLNDFSGFIRVQFAREFKGKELEEKVSAMKQDLLQRLIEDRLMLQQAKNEKIVIESARIQAKINDIKKRYGSEAEFENDLAKQGLVQADLENKIREQMLMYAVVEEKVRVKIIIRPDEITSFFNENKQQFLKPEERQLTVIVIQDDSVANTVSYNLRRGDKLEDLASKYPFTVDKLSAWQGENLRKEIEQTVFKLGLGEVSNPVKIDAQYYVFKLENILGSQQLNLSQSQEKIQAYLFEKRLQERLAKYLDELKKQSYIKIITS